MSSIKLACVRIYTGLMWTQWYRRAALCSSGSAVDLVKRSSGRGFYPAPVQFYLALLVVLAILPFLLHIQLFYCSDIASTVLCELVFVLLDSELRTSLEDIRHVLLCCACANCAMHIPGKISGMCCSGKIFGICFERQLSLSSCYQCTVCGTTFTHVHWECALCRQWMCQKHRFRCASSQFCTNIILVQCQPLALCSVPVLQQSSASLCALLT